MNVNLIHLITGRILLLDNSDFILSLKTHASLVCWPLLCTAMVGWFPGFQVYLIFLPGEAGYFAERKLIME